LGPSRLADAIRAGTGDPEGPERAVLAALILDLRDEMRREPLGPAPVLRYALMLRAQTLDLRRIIWGLSLGVPGALLGEGLVTT
jgi:hypothetical protein